VRCDEREHGFDVCVIERLDRFAFTGLGAAESQTGDSLQAVEH
jgi:hypothetical protein